MKDLQKPNMLGDVNNVSGLSAFLQSLKGVKQEIVEFPRDEVVSIFDAFNEKTKIGAQETADYIDTVRVSNSTMADYLQSIGDGEPTFQGYQAYCQQAAQSTQQLSLKTKIAAAGMKLLAGALNIGITMLATWAVSKAFKWVDDLIHKEEKIAEKAQEAQNAIKELNTEIDNLSSSTNEIKDRYAELAQGVNQLNGKNLTLSTEDYEEFLDLSNQLADLFPELVKGYDENGNAILDLSGSVNTIVLSLNDLIKSEKELANQQILEEMPNVYKGFSQNISRYSESLKNARAEYQALLDISSGNFVENEWQEGTYTISFEVDKDSEIAVERAINEVLHQSGVSDNDFNYWYDGNNLQLNITNGYYEKIEEIQENIKESISTIPDYIKDASSNLESEYANFNSTLINNVLATDYDYTSLSNDMQFVVQQIIGEIDWAEAEKNFTEEGWDGAQAYVDSIIESLSNASYDVKKAMTELFNNSDLNFEQRNAYLDSIIEYYESNELEIPVIFTLQKDPLDNLQRRINNSFRILTDDHGIVDRDEWSELEDFTKDFTEEQYELWFEVTQDINDASEAMAAFTTATERAIEKAEELSYIDIVSGVENLSDGLDKLADIYVDVKDGEDFDYSSLLNNEEFVETFGEYEEAYNEFIQTIVDSPNDIQACQNAFNKLATAYINGSGALDNLTEETKEATIIMLEQMGIVNANEVVTRELAVQQEVATYQTNELKDATYEEVYALYAEATAGSIAEQALAQYAFEKLATSEIDIRESDNIEELMNLAQAAGASAEYMDALSRAMQLVAEVKMRGSDWLSAADEEFLNSFTNGTFKPEFEIDSNNFKYDGSIGRDDPSSSSSSSEDAWKEAFEKELATLQHYRAMEYITEAEYYAQLQILNEKYFAGREEYLDDYRKYEEEIYSGLKDVYKKYIEAQINLLNAQLDNATISYDDYLNKLTDLINSFYAEGKISAEDYYGYLDDLYSKQLDIYDKVKGTVVDYIKDQIDELEEQKEAIESTYQLQIDALESEKEALEKANEARQDAIDLQKKLYELNRAQYQRDNFVYTSDKGFVYRPDESNIRDAQNDLDDAQYENKIKEIDNQISILEQTMASATDGIDDQIEALNEYAEQWESVSDVYDDAINEIYTAELLGQNWEEEVMGMRQQILTDFTNNYVALQQAQADAAVQAANKIVEANNNIANSQTTAPTTISNTANNGTGSSGTPRTSTANTSSDNPKKDTSKDNPTGKYYIYDNNGVRRYPQGFNTSGEAWSYLIGKVGTYDVREHYKVLLKKFAKGGVVGKDKNILDALANAVGEDHVVAAKEGERILTSEQNQSFEKLVDISEHFKPLKQGDFPFLDAFMNNMDKLNLSAFNNQNLLANNVKQNNISDAYGVNNNAPIINIQNPVFTCTGVTGEQVLKEIQGQFEGLFINAYQKAMKR